LNAVPQSLSSKQKSDLVPMRMILFTLLLNAVCATATAAIDPSFDGPDGIRERVFRPSCLGCHGSDRKGPERRGAPLNLNWDVYEVAKANGARILNATLQRYMPPAGRGFPALNEAQRQALLAWEDAGFPESPVPLPAGNTFNFNTMQLHIPEVVAAGFAYQVRLRLVLLSSRPAVYGFELLSAVPLEGIATDTPPILTAAGRVELQDVLLLNDSTPERGTRVLATLQRSSTATSTVFVLEHIEWQQP